jgi:flagellar basal-body rod modification protein FlgD
MSTVNGTTGTTIASTASTTNTGSLGGTGTASSSSTDPLLDKNAFLKLMMTQLQDQDPLNPSDPSQYLNQLAQMTSVEQETNVASTVAQSAAEQNASAALSLLGHSVSYTDANGDAQTGLVQKVDFSGSGPSLTVAGVSGISPSAVSEVSS